MKFKIGGIYNNDIVRHLSLMNINDYVFDLRPLSMKFIQVYKACEIINNSNTNKTKFLFQFEDEKDFVVKQTIINIQKDLKLDQSFSLFFSGSESFDFCEQFNTNYSLKYSERLNLNDLSKQKYLKNLMIDYDHLERLLNFSKLSEFITSLSKTNIPLVLIGKFGQQMMESIIDFVDFESCLFQLDETVELGFRNLDLAKLNQAVAFSESIFKNKLTNNGKYNENTN